MNNYRIEYTCYDGYSDTLYVQAPNDLAAYAVCQEIFADMNEAIVSIACYLEDEKMPKCPRCGSTAQVREEETESGWDACVIRRYSCGCGNIFSLLYPCNNRRKELEIEED